MTVALQEIWVAGSVLVNIRLAKSNFDYWVEWAFGLSTGSIKTERQTDIRTYVSIRSQQNKSEFTEVTLYIYIIYVVISKVINAQ